MEKLPLEILKEKYIPIVAFAEKYNISLVKLKSLVDKGILKYTEFKAPGDTRRTMHVNPEDVFAILKKEDSHESTTSSRSEP